MLRQLLRPVSRNISRRDVFDACPPDQQHLLRSCRKCQGRHQYMLKRTRAYHDPTPFKPASMDELPVPQGSWQQYHDAKQKTYNMQLAAGLAYFIGTITYIISTEAIFFNWAPPERK